jgi:hypothetical protein
MKRNRLLFIISLIVWILMMCLLLKEHYGAYIPDEEGDALRLLRRMPAATNWYGIYDAGRKIGYGELAVTADVLDEAVVQNLYLYLKLVFPKEVIVNGGITLRERGGINSFSLDTRTGAGMIHFAGKRKGNDVVINYDFGGFPAPRFDSFPRTVTSPKGSFLLPIDALRPRATIRIGREEVITIRGVFMAARKYMISYGNSEVELWMDEYGNLLRLEFPIGISLVSEPRSLAMKI